MQKNDYRFDRNVSGMSTKISLNRIKVESYAWGSVISPFPSNKI